MSATLQELAANLRAQLNAIDPETGEVADSVAFDIAAETFERKIEACAMAYREILADSKAARDLADHYDRRTVAIEKRAESLLGYMERCMREASQAKVQTPTVTAWFKKTDTVEVADLAKLDTKYLVQPEAPPARPDKKAIKAAVKAGEEVAGAELVEHEHLQLR